MKRSAVILLTLGLVINSLIASGIASEALNGYKSVIQKSFDVGVNDQGGPRRALLSDSRGSDTALVAALDGTILLLELDSMKPLWSFPSGSAIYSSYQAPPGDDDGNSSKGGSDYYIDCGDDFELYAHSKLGKLKLTKTLEEYVSSTPQIAEDGSIVLGSKKTTAFLVDANTGRLIHTYKIPDPSTMSDNSENSVFFNSTVEELGLSQDADELPLYITRTDYALTSFAPNSNKVLWNMTVAEVGAASLCQEFDKSINGALLDSGSSATGFNMPLPCQSRALVYRFRNHDMLEPFIRPIGLPDVNSHDKMLQPSISNEMVLPSQPHVDKVIDYLPLPKSILPNQNVGKDNVLFLPAPEVTEQRNGGDGRMDGRISSSLLYPAALFIFLVLTYVFRRFKEPSNRNLGTGTSKKKKTKKAGKNGNIAEKSGKEPMPNRDSDDNSLWQKLPNPFSSTDGRKIGKLFLTSNEIAKGSNGTVVLEGIYEGRPVAVKRLVRAHHDVALKEIQNLIVSDTHPNIVRWYGVEHDQDFVYLSLERCICSLNDLIQMFSDTCETVAVSNNDQEVAKYKMNMGSIKESMQDTMLWKTHGYPSPILLKLLRDVISGLVHLHELGIIHRDLKPQNVLIIKDRCLCAKVSDMGISKRLTGDMASLGQQATGYGSSGWQAPEQLLDGRQTRAVDIFSLGCVLFFCITRGSHPFGDRLERDINITKNKVDLFLVDHIPEAKELFSRVLNPSPELRPRAVEVLAHPLFWDAEMRLSFLREASDRVELEDRENGSQLLLALENTASTALSGKWDVKMDPAFLKNIGSYRRYKYDSIRDLLRVMRNKLNHYRELPTEIQEILGSVPEGFDSYFASRFPNLLIEVYKVMGIHCKEEESFVKYFTCNV